MKILLSDLESAIKLLKSETSSVKIITHFSDSMSCLVLEAQDNSGGTLRIELKDADSNVLSKVSRTKNLNGKLI
jgi:hypothetical protein